MVKCPKHPKIDLENDFIGANGYCNFCKDWYEYSNADAHKEYQKWLNKEKSKKCVIENEGVRHG